MELRQVRYFAAVAHHRHFTRTAEALGLAQPAHSQQIRSLERELGILLIDRSGRRVRLTDAGESFLLWADRIVADVAAAEAELAEFAGLAKGRVILGTTPCKPSGASICRGCWRHSMSSTPASKSRCEKRRRLRCSQSWRLAASTSRLAR